MANAIIKFPLLNPVKMVRATNVQDYFWNQQIPSFETQTDYVQKFQQGDYIQFAMAFNPAYVASANIFCQLRDCHYNQTYGYFQPLPIAFVSGDFIHINFKLTLHNPTIPEGEYYIYLYCPNHSGSNFDLFYSEKISIKATHSDTILLKYSNEGNEFDTYFYLDYFGASKTYFQLRVPGGFPSDGFNPSSIDSIFQDQTYNTTLLSSIPYNVKKVTFGDNKGIPDWLIDKINRVLSCTHTYVDDVQYTKVEGARLKPNFMPGHPLNVWKIDLIASDNDYSKTHYGRDIINASGLEEMAVEVDFIIEPNTEDETVATALENGLMKPKKITLGAITAGVAEIVSHDLGLPNYIWQIRDTNNEVQFSTNIKDPDNPTTAIKIVSEVDVAAGLELNIVGFYNI